MDSQAPYATGPATGAEFAVQGLLANVMYPSDNPFIGDAENRLVIGGDSDAAGEWCVSGVPAFDHASGRFTGYRGTARRLDQPGDPIELALTARNHRDVCAFTRKRDRSCFTDAGARTGDNGHRAGHSACRHEFPLPGYCGA